MGNHKEVYVQFGNACDTDGAKLAKTYILGYEENKTSKNNPFALVLYVGNKELFIGRALLLGSRGKSVVFSNAEYYCTDCRYLYEFPHIEIPEDLISRFKILEITQE